MKIPKSWGNLLSPQDPELVKLTLDRLAEQDKWNDVFSTKLIEVLDKIDILRKEHRTKLRELDTTAQEVQERQNRVQVAYDSARKALEAAREEYTQAVIHCDCALNTAKSAERRCQEAERKLEKEAERQVVLAQQLQATHALIQQVKVVAIWAAAVFCIVQVWLACHIVCASTPYGVLLGTTVASFIAAALLSRKKRS